MSMDELKTSVTALVVEERLAQLAMLGWDWDSYGAPPIGKQAIDCARRLLAVLSHPPQIIPTSQGGVQLEWHRDGIDVDLTIPPEGATEFFASPSEDDSEHLAGGVIRRAAYLMASRREGVSIVDSYGAAYRVLFSYLYPDQPLPNASALEAW